MVVERKKKLWRPMNLLTGCGALERPAQVYVVPFFLTDFLKNLLRRATGHGWRVVSIAVSWPYGQFPFSLKNLASFGLVI